MSRTQRRTPVLSALQREIIERETQLTIGRRIMASCPDLPAGFVLDDGSAPGVGAMVRDLIVAGTATRRVETLLAGASAIRTEAEASGLDLPSLVDLEQRLSRAGAVDGDSDLAADVSGSALAELVTAADAIAERRIEAEIHERVRAAATIALRRAGLGDVHVCDDLDGVTTLTAIRASGEGATLSVSVDGVEIDVDDPADAVGPLDPAARDVCVGAERLATDVGTLLTDALLEVGLTAGDIEIVEPATRGTAASRAAHQVPRLVRPRAARSTR